MKANLGALVATGIALLAVVACSSKDGIGTSDDELRRDSFDKPTAHGELRFAAVPNEAAFTDDQRFHSWSFSLTDDARLDLRTQVSQNLDTVIYLYRRDAGSNAPWGASIASNDDTGGTIASRLNKKLQAGEYLLKAKARKEQLRGPFSVLASCSGQGCPAPAEACAPRSFAKMPDATGYGSSCKATLDGVLSSPITARSDTTATLSTKCGLQPTERFALDLYHAYWDDLAGWSEFTMTGEDDDEAMVTINTESHGTSGTVIDVDIEADESAMTFVFDGAGKLLFYYQHNQSPTWEWFCRGSEAASAEPDESCVSDSINDADADGKRRFSCP